MTDETTITPLEDPIINEVPYDPTQVKVDLKPYTVFQIVRKIRLNEINLQPNFQRRLVWDRTRQSRLIESILINIPLPAFYLDAITINKWQVVDGLQRLTTLSRFCLHNQLRLKNLEFFKELEGKNFEELPRQYQRQIEDTHLNLYIIQPDVPEEVKFTIFYRINTGGMTLTSQEIRHCLFHGQSTEFLKNLAESEKVQIVTDYALSQKRMDDRESILRFLAFHLTPYTEYKKSDFDEFLSHTMQTINRMGPEQLRDLRNMFFDTLNKAATVFGPYAFRKVYEVDGRRYPINKSLFEVWCVALTNYDEAELETHKEAIMEAFVRLMNEDDDFEKAISRSTGSVKNVQQRFSKVENLLAEVIGH